MAFETKCRKKRQKICMPQKDYRGKDFHRQILRRTERKTGQSLKWPNVSKMCDHERTQKRIEALGRTKPVAVDNKFYKAFFDFYSELCVLYSNGQKLFQQFN